MPQSQEIAELWLTVREVQAVASNHVSACGERNRSRDRWEADTDRELTAIRDEIGKNRTEIMKLTISEAKQAGWFAGAAAVGGVIGTVVATLASKFMHF